jgi:hypothetical protein
MEYILERQSKIAMTPTQRFSFSLTSIGSCDKALATVPFSCVYWLPLKIFIK